MSYPATILADSPILYLPVWDKVGGSAYDASTHANPGSYLGGQGGPTIGVKGPGITTGARFQSAQAQVVQVPRIAAYAVGDTMSFEIWFNLISSGVCGLMSFGHTAGSNGSAYMRINGGGFEVLSTNTAGIAGPNGTYNDGHWHHAVWTKATTTNHMYIDAVDMTPGVTNATLQDGSENPVIGGDVSNGVLAETFDGMLAHAAAYNVALTPTQVSAHFAAMTETPSLVARAPGYRHVSPVGFRTRR